MACWACNYGDECCEGVWVSVRAKPYREAIRQTPRFCLRCLERFYTERAQLTQRGRAKQAR